MSALEAARLTSASGKQWLPHLYSSRWSSFQARPCPGMMDCESSNPPCELLPSARRCLIGAHQ